MIRLVHGVGVNDSESTTQSMVDGKLTHCPYYQRWCSMLKRCYSAKYQSVHPSYAGCSVCAEWLVFSNFKTWMRSQKWQGKDLDKDLLVRGNKLYSPETCVFVSHAVNSFMADRAKARGEYPLGVCIEKRTNRFVAACFSVVSGRQERLGTFKDADEAHRAWAEFKLQQAVILARRQNDLRVSVALVARYTAYKLEAAA